MRVGLAEGNERNRDLEVRWLGLGFFLGLKLDFVLENLVNFIALVFVDRDVWRVLIFALFEIYVDILVLVADREIFAIVGKFHLEDLSSLAGLLIFVQSAYLLELSKNQVFLDILRDGRVKLINLARVERDNDRVAGDRVDRHLRRGVSEG